MILIRCRLIYRAGQKRKVLEFLERYSHRTEKELHELQIVKYWKDERQFDIAFILSSDKNKKEELVYEILLLANQLTEGAKGEITVTGPIDTDDLQFECIWNSNDNQGLQWAHLQLENK